MRAFLAFFAFLILLALTAEAHTLKVDGSVGVLMHIDPDDEPTAGSESKIFVDIQSQGFGPSLCKCTLFIENGQSAEFPVTAGGTYTQIRYKFPSSGIYKLKVAGDWPQSFEVEFEYYVKAGLAGSAYVPESNPMMDYFPFVALLAGIAIILMFFMRRD